MLTTNQFLTLRATQHIQDLNDVGVAIQVMRNSRFYFNREGLLIHIKPKHNGEWIRYVWYTEYKKATTDPPVDGTTETIGGDDYTVVVDDTFEGEVRDINLLNVESERINRSYSSVSDIRVYTRDETGTPMLSLELPIETTPLPAPIIKEFVIDPIADGQTKLRWKGTNPGDFYTYKLYDNWSNNILWSGVAGVFEYSYTVPSIVQGQEVTFTLEVLKGDVVYDRQSLSLLFPRVEFNVFHRLDSETLRNTKAIYTKVNDTLINVARIWYKKGGFWYTG